MGAKGCAPNEAGHKGQKVPTPGELPARARAAPTPVHSAKITKVRRAAGADVDPATAPAFTGTQPGKPGKERRRASRGGARNLGMSRINRSPRIKHQAGQHSRLSRDR